MKREGFTLVEITIVIIVIGIIIAMVMGSMAIIDTVKLRSDIAKVRKFQVATTMYYAEHGKLPDYNHIDSCNFDFVTDYSKYISDKDYVMSSSINSYFGISRTRFKTEKAVYLYQGGCDNSTNNMYPLVILTSSKYKIISSDMHYYEAAPEYFPRKLACNIEIILDDRNLTHGRGRAVGTNTEQLNQIKDSDFDDCMKFAADVKNGYDKDTSNTTIRYGYLLFFPN